MGPVNVAQDVCRILMFLTDYICQTLLTDDGVVVKVGNTANKQARVVNVSAHRQDDSNWLEDKFLAVRLAYRLHRSLKQS